LQQVLGIVASTRLRIITFFIFWILNFFLLIWLFRIRPVFFGEFWTSPLRF
jgi:uncharacterized protein with PQ loop repeat